MGVVMGAVMRFVVLAILLSLLPHGVAAGEEERARVRELLGRGDFDGAAAALDALGDDPERDVLWGVVHLGRLAPDSAVVRFERAAAQHPERESIWLYLGQAYFAAGHAADGLAALDRGEELGRTLRGYYGLRSRVQLELGRLTDALDTLEFGIAVFPDSAELYRDRAVTLLEEGLATAAVDAARTYRDRFPGEEIAWLVLGSAHVEARELDAGVQVLEEARLRFPSSVDITRLLATVYARRGWHLSAGRTYAALGENGAYDAAEQLRLAGRHREALRWNLRVPDETLRVNQRIALFVEGERFEAAMALVRTVGGAAPLEDTVAYHVGYAALQTENFDTARDMAARIETARPDLARSLREAAERCAEEPWACR